MGLKHCHFALYACAATQADHQLRCFDPDMAPFLVTHLVCDLEIAQQALQSSC